MSFTKAINRSWKFQITAVKAAWAQHHQLTGAACHRPPQGQCPCSQAENPNETKGRSFSSHFPKAIHPNWFFLSLEQQQQEEEEFLLRGWRRECMNFSLPPHKGAGESETQMRPEIPSAKQLISGFRTQMYIQRRKLFPNIWKEGLEWAVFIILWCFRDTKKFRQASRELYAHDGRQNQRKI